MRPTWSPRRLGWDVVPMTFLRDGPHGLGDGAGLAGGPDDERGAGRPSSATCASGPGWLHVFDGVDERRPATVVAGARGHPRRCGGWRSSTSAVNNADRKGGHVLPMAGGHRYGVDHGVCLPRRPQAAHGAVGLGRLRRSAEDEVSGPARRSPTRWTRTWREALAPAADGVRDRGDPAPRGPAAARRGDADAPRADWPAIPWPPF